MGKQAEEATPIATEMQARARAQRRTKRTKMAKKGPKMGKKGLQRYSKFLERYLADIFSNVKFIANLTYFSLVGLEFGI